MWRETASAGSSVFDYFALIRIFPVGTVALLYLGGSSKFQLHLVHITVSTPSCLLSVRSGSSLIADELSVARICSDQHLPYSKAHVFRYAPSSFRP